MDTISKINVNGTTYQLGGSGGSGSSDPEIVKGYLSSGSFYTETHTVITPSTDKLYIDTTANKMYIYNGSAYVEVNNISVMGASGSNHASGLVPDPGSTLGTSKFLREDGTWQNPPVTSSDLATKQDKLSVVSQAASSFTAAIDKYYNISSNVGTMTITLPTMTDSTKTAGLIIYFTTGSSPALTINSASNLTINYFSDYTIEASKSYELNCLWNGTKWIIAYGTIG